MGNPTSRPSVHVENEHTISGSRMSEGWGGRRVMYFVLQFSKPFKSFGIEQDGQRLAAEAHEAARGSA